MCFTKSNLKSISTAEADIVCYKLLRKSDNSISSPFKKRYKWNDKKIRKSDIDDSKYNRKINEGFHSFIGMKNAVYFGSRMYDRSKLFIYKVIIPKGSKYFKNRTQYVSNQIKLASKVPIQSISKKK